MREDAHMGREKGVGSGDVRIKRRRNKRKGDVPPLSKSLSAKRATMPLDVLPI